MVVKISSHRKLWSQDAIAAGRKLNLKMRIGWTPAHAMVLEKRDCTTNLLMPLACQRFINDQPIQLTQSLHGGAAAQCVNVIAAAERWACAPQRAVRR